MVTEDRVINLEATLARFIEHTDLIVAEIRAGQARTDRQLLEMQQQADKERQQADKDRKDFNKRLAEISDSMGTLIEDMVAPCGFQLTRTIFGSEEAQTCAIRVKRKHPARPGEVMELDLLAIGPAKLLVVEVKRRIDAAKVAEYRDKLKRLPEFFPELAGKTLCAAVASVYVESSVIAFLNREKVYGIAMGDEVMEVINLGQF
jgi:Holliday junction resolvase